MGKRGIKIGSGVAGAAVLLIALYASMVRTHEPSSGAEESSFSLSFSGHTAGQYSGQASGGAFSPSHRSDVRPDPPSSGQEAAKGDPSDRAPAGFDESPMEHDFKAPMILGAYLDRKTTFELRSSRGMDHFLKQFSGFQDFSHPVQEVNQFWEQMRGRPMTEREALLHVTEGMVRASGDESLKGVLLKEFDDFSQPSENGPVADQDVQYAEKALQLYLNHIQTTPHWEEEMERRGIPVIRVPASAPESEGPAHPQNQ
jgi:hypothetical protein